VESIQKSQSFSFLEREKKMPWVCESCTFVNKDSSKSACEICATARSSTALAFEETKAWSNNTVAGPISSQTSIQTGFGIDPDENTLDPNDWGNDVKEQGESGNWEGDWDEDGVAAEFQTGKQDNAGKDDDDLDWGEEDDDDVDVSHMEDIPDNHLQLTRQLSVEGVNVLDMDNVDTLRDMRIREIAELFGLSTSAAATVLRAKRWNRAAVQEAWIANSGGLQDMVCTSSAPSASSQAAGQEEEKELECMLCCDDEITSATSCDLGCGHVACDACYTNWVQAESEKGPPVLYMKCIGGCPKVCGDDVLRRYFPAGKKASLEAWIRDDFVNASSDLKYCTSANCSRAIRAGTAGWLGVVCSCGHAFCFTCQEKNHDPAPCAVAKEWLKKETNDDANSVWLTGNTKQCPSCKTPIEKNQGCQHMTCAKCRHEFCWVCMGGWRGHRSCNRYDGSNVPNENSAQEARRILARYTHFYDRYSTNNNAVKFAEKTRVEAMSKTFDLQELNGLTDMGTGFLLKAAECVITCRRVLAWTYCCGFYLKAADGSSERHLFDIQQGTLEEITDKLQGSIEKPVEALRAEKMKVEIVQMMTAANKYTKNLVQTVKEHVFQTENEMGSGSSNKKQKKKGYFSR